MGGLGPENQGISRHESSMARPRHRRSSKTSVWPDLTPRSPRAAHQRCFSGRNGRIVEFNRPAIPVFSSVVVNPGTIFIASGPDKGRDQYGALEKAEVNRGTAQEQPDREKKPANGSPKKARRSRTC